MPFDGTIGLPQPRRNWVTEFGRKLSMGWLRSPEAKPPEEQLALRVAIAREAVIVLDEVADMLDGGNNWIRGRYRSKRGYCLLGALRAVHCSRKARLMASAHLTRAIGDLCGKEQGIIEFNDSQVTFAKICQVIERAKQYTYADCD